MCVIFLVNCVLGLVLAPEEGSSMLLACCVLCSFDKSSMFYTCWYDVKLPDDDLKKSKLVGVLVNCMQKIFFLICAFVGVNY
jgi:hypothetical protein